MTKEARSTKTEDSHHQFCLVRHSDFFRHLLAAPKSDGGGAFVIRHSQEPEFFHGLQLTNRGEFQIGPDFPALRRTLKAQSD
jgi:hypothetical protein